MSKSEQPLYKRILIKMSGEGLTDGKLTIDPATLARLAGEIKSVLDMGVQICIVLGGGNIFRGVAGATRGMDRTTADYMGMLATVMNGLAFADALRHLGVDARVQSAIPMPTVCEAFIGEKAASHLKKKRVVVFVAGTGNPYFTTDTAGVLRALEMRCDAVFKSTGVDGVYDRDPKKEAGAVRFDVISYADVLAKKLKVMDMAAIALARDSRLPVVVYNQNTPGLIKQIVCGKGICTKVSEIAL